jgi:hypothetical protein
MRKFDSFYKNEGIFLPVAEYVKCLIVRAYFKIILIVYKLDTLKI